MVMTICISYVFEIWGRKNTLFFSYLITAVVYFAIPYTAPNFHLLIVLRCLVGFSMSAPLGHPLIADYYKRSSRGKAVALAGFGIVVGEVFSMGVLFNITKSMNYYDAFSIAAAIIMMFNFYFLFAIIEPDMDSIRNNSESRHNQLNREKSNMNLNSKANLNSGAPS